MQFLYKQMYLAIKSHLKDIIPSNFFARLILANNAKRVGKRGFVLHLKAPNGKFIFNKHQLLQYCEENHINFMNFKNLKFRYYLKNYHFPSETSMLPKEKFRLLFAYTKEILSDEKNGVFSYFCCNRQFCQKLTFEQHRDAVHSNIKLN